MRLTRDLDAAQLELRELSDDSAADSPYIAELEGVAAPYGEWAQISPELRESFGPDAFDPAQVVGQPLTWRHGDPVGVITEAWNADGALRFRAGILPTALGRDAAQLVKARAVRGVSVGFLDLGNVWNRTRDAVTRTRAQLLELALTHQPAYAAAGIGNVREETIMEPDQAPTTQPDQAAPVPQYATQDELAQLRERVATMTHPAPQRAELSADEYLRELGAARVNQRAWPAGVSLDGKASDIPPVPAGVSAVVEIGRPTVTAIGVDRLADTGMDATWMLDKVLPTVDEQTAEFSPVSATMPEGELVSAPVKTYAGGNRMSLQFLARASVWDYPHLLRTYAEQYARRTNVVVAAAVQAAAANTISIPATGLTLEQLAEKLGKGAAAIAAATGRAPSVVVLDPDKFFRIGVMTGQGFPLAGGTAVGSASLSGLSYSALGLRWVCDPSLTNGGYMLDTESIGIKESPGAPFQIDAAVVQELARDTALYGFLAYKVLNPGGIVSFYQPPTK